jgi:uncharacterized membrane protein
MNFFFLIFFLFLGGMGLFYRNDVGVFVGFGLLPWQVIRLGKGKLLDLVAIIICTIIGISFFILTANWKFMVLFLFIQLYNLWGHYQTEKRNNNLPEQANNNQ